MAPAVAQPGSGLSLGLSGWKGFEMTSEFLQKQRPEEGEPTD